MCEFSLLFLHLYFYVCSFLPSSCPLPLLYCSSWAEGNLLVVVPTTLLVGATTSVQGARRVKARGIRVKTSPLYCELFWEPITVSATDKQREKGHDIRVLGAIAICIQGLPCSFSPSHRCVIQFPAPCRHTHSTCCAADLLSEAKAFSVSNLLFCCSGNHNIHVQDCHPQSWQWRKTGTRQKGLVCRLQEGVKKSVLLPLWSQEWGQATKGWASPYALTPHTPATTFTRCSSAHFWFIPS